MSKKTLIIVESPTKARTLTRYLGKGYQIEASMGHIRDLPQKELGVDLNKDFAPSYEVPQDKKKVVKALRDAAKEKGTDVVIATDPDREGEAIGYHVEHVLTAPRSKKEMTEPKLKRIVFHQITKAAVEHALESPRTIDMNLVDAQQGRRVLDRLMGYKLSPLLWSKTGKRWLSAGRVQSIAVRLIVEREREIKAFIADEYWELYAHLKDPNSADTDNGFYSQLTKINGKKAEIGSEKQSKIVLDDLEKAAYVVSDVRSKELRKNPYPPFITSTLQRSAASLFGWPARKTMTIAQNLYEKGKITYHRTDSVNLSPEALKLARDYITKEHGKKYLPEKPNFYKTKSKVAQEAHEAIRPTDISGEVSTNGLGRDHQKLLDLITKRFVASQMTQQLVQRNTIEISAKNSKEYLLRTSGEREVFDGWRVLFKSAKSKEKNGELVDFYKLKFDPTGPLPEVKIDDKLNLTKLHPLQKFTQPPPRFNEASLIKALEDEGIGRPSTYAPIISTIQARQYVEKNDSRAFMPTGLGMAVNDFLVKHFDEEINVSFTAGMEDKLDDIANGNRKWTEVIGEFWKPFEKDLLAVRKDTDKIEIPQKKTGEKCPECGGDLIERVGRYGKFLACNNFPTCKFTKPIVITIDMKCPTCKDGDVVMKKTKKGRKFYGCSNYPKCEFASWQKPKK